MSLHKKNSSVLNYVCAALVAVGVATAAPAFAEEPAKARIVEVHPVTRKAHVSGKGLSSVSQEIKALGRDVETIRVNLDTLASDYYGSQTRLSTLEQGQVQLSDMLPSPNERDYLSIITEAAVRDSRFGPAFAQLKPLADDAYRAHSSYLVAVDNFSQQLRTIMAANAVRTSSCGPLSGRLRSRVGNTERYSATELTRVLDAFAQNDTCLQVSTQQAAAITRSLESINDKEEDFRATQRAFQDHYDTLVEMIPSLGHSAGDTSSIDMAGISLEFFGGYQTSNGQTGRRTTANQSGIFGVGFFHHGSYGRAGARVTVNLPQGSETRTTEVAAESLPEENLGDGYLRTAEVTGTDTTIEQRVARANVEYGYPFTFGDQGTLQLALQPSLGLGASFGVRSLEEYRQMTTRLLHDGHLVPDGNNPSTTDGTNTIPGRTVVYPTGEAGLRLGLENSVVGAGIEARAIVEGRSNLVPAFEVTGYLKLIDF